MHETYVSTGAFVWGLQALCDLHRIPFTPALALQQFAPPYSLLSLQQATEAAGLKSGLRRVPLKELPRLPTPYVATIVLSGQPAQLADPNRGDKGGSCRLAVVLNCDGQHISFIEEGAREPVSSTLEEFAPRYRGEVLLRTPAASVAHQLPKGLKVDGVVTLGPRESRISVVAEERKTQDPADPG